jgi:hypothetical protein
MSGSSVSAARNAVTTSWSSSSPGTVSLTRRPRRRTSIGLNAPSRTDAHTAARLARCSEMIASGERLARSRRCPPLRRRAWRARRPRRRALRWRAAWRGPPRRHGGGARRARLVAAARGRCGGRSSLVPPRPPLGDELEEVVEAQRNERLGAVVADDGDGDAPGRGRRSWPGAARPGRSAACRAWPRARTPGSRRRASPRPCGTGGRAGWSRPA